MSLISFEGAIGGVVSSSFFDRSHLPSPPSKVLPTNVLSSGPNAISTRSGTLAIVRPIAVFPSITPFMSHSMIESPPPGVSNAAPSAGKATLSTP